MFWIQQLMLLVNNWKCRCLRVLELMRVKKNWTQEVNLLTHVPAVRGSNPDPNLQFFQVLLISSHKKRLQWEWLELCRLSWNQWMTRYEPLTSQVALQVVFWHSVWWSFNWPPSPLLFPQACILNKYQKLLPYPSQVFLFLRPSCKGIQLGVPTMSLHQT